MGRARHEKDACTSDRCNDASYENILPPLLPYEREDRENGPAITRAATIPKTRRARMAGALTGKTVIKKRPEERRKMRPEHEFEE
jgi:hypothetical protein